MELFAADGHDAGGCERVTGKSGMRPSATDVQDLLGRMLAGERPFEEWMHAHGRSDEETAEIYRLIDQWLMKEGVVPSAAPFPNRN